MYSLKRIYENFKKSVKLQQNQVRRKRLHAISKSEGDYHGTDAKTRMTGGAQVNGVGSGLVGYAAIVLRQCGCWRKIVIGIWLCTCDLGWKIKQKKQLLLRHGRKTTEILYGDTAVIISYRVIHR